MPRTSIEQEIRTCVESFALDLQSLVWRAVLEKVAAAVDSMPIRAPVAESVPISLRHYERMAILRALTESGGNPQTAAESLGIARSTIYRRMEALGIRAPGPSATLEIVAGDPVAATGEPVSFAAYERAALERALEAAGGNALEACKLLGVSKSTMYRKLSTKGGLPGA